MPRQEGHSRLMAAEHIGGGCPGRVEDLDTPPWRGYDVLTHTPASREWTEALHRRGICSVPYLNLGYEYASDYPPGEAPEFAVVDRLGRAQLNENYRRHDGKLVYLSCHNAAACRDLCLKRAERMMQSGADGLFLDNAGPSPKCWGPRFERHAHVFAGEPAARPDGHRPFCYSKAQRRYRLEVPIADPEQTYATAMLIRELRELVRGFRPDNVLIINGGDGSGMPPLFFEHVDGVMNEMFIYATYLDFNLPVPTDLDFQDHDVMDWLSVLEWEEQFLRGGVRLANFSSFSAHDPERKAHSFFAFCVSKLWDALYYTTAQADVDLWMRDIRLGAPLSEGPGASGAVLYREYEKGLVAANLYGVAQEAWVPWTGKPNEVAVHRSARGLSVARQTLKPDADGTVPLKLFPDSAALIVPCEK